MGKRGAAWQGDRAQAYHAGGSEFNSWAFRLKGPQLENNVERSQSDQSLQHCCQSQ